MMKPGCRREKFYQVLLTFAKVDDREKVVDVTSAAGPWGNAGEPLPVRLMSTLWADRYAVHDALAGASDLGAWLVQTGLLERAAPSTAQAESARHLRDALRRLAAQVTDDARDRAISPLDLSAAVATINETIAAAPETERLRVATTGLVRDVVEEAAPVTAALGGVARQGLALVTDDPTPLRACHAPGCVLYFVKDHPRREWCSLACGNRARAARHYARRTARG
jgi:predicted RNA-binding Zn ribbon-like protein